MTLLYDRRCIVVVCKVPGVDLTEKPAEATRIEGFRMQFKATKTDKPEPNKLELEITNLKSDTRAALEKDRGLRILLQAGYKDSTSQIFAGESRYVNNKRENVDWTTKIEALDGGRAYKYARAEESFGPGSKVGDVVKKMVGKLSKDPGNALQLASQLTREFNAGYTASGPAARVLSELLEQEGYSWSMQDGRVEILKKDQTLADEVPLVSPDTGLVGSPELGAPAKKGGAARLKCKMLMHGQIRPGQKFQLDATGRKGAYRAHVVVHSGDTHGGDWFTEIEASPVS